jgi:hypothetical protein
LSFLYRLRSSCSCGMCDCIFHMEFRCLMNSGTMMSRIRTTRMTMDRPQVTPLDAPNGTASTAWMRIIIHATASNSGFRMLN